MTWIQRYNLRHCVQNSIWILPVSGMAAESIPSSLAMNPATGLRVRACGCCHL
jgi:hypothetical protein